MELIQIQLDNQKESSKMLEGQKQKQKWKIETQLKNTITELENQIEETKDNAEKERNEKQREAEDNITQMRNFYDLEK